MTSTLTGCHGLKQATWSLCMVLATIGATHSQWCKPMMMIVRPYQENPTNEVRKIIPPMDTVATTFVLPPPVDTRLSVDEDKELDEELCGCTPFTPSLASFNVDIYTSHCKQR